MGRRPPPAKTADSILRQSATLKALFGAARLLDQLQKEVEAALEPSAREHCRVASWRDGTLLLIASNGHWATRLHYQQRRLQRQLQQSPRFQDLQRILIKVQPQGDAAASTARQVTLSHQAADSLRDAAEGIEDPRLKAALERLARHADH